MGNEKKKGKSKRKASKRSEVMHPSEYTPSSITTSSKDPTDKSHKDASSAQSTCVETFPVPTASRTESAFQPDLFPTHPSSFTTSQPTFTQPSASGSCQTTFLVKPLTSASHSESSVPTLVVQPMSTASPVPTLLLQSTSYTPTITLQPENSDDSLPYFRVVFTPYNPSDSTQNPPGYTPTRYILAANADGTVVAYAVNCLNNPPISSFPACGTFTEAVEATIDTITKSGFFGVGNKEFEDSPSNSATDDSLAFFDQTQTLPNADFLQSSSASKQSTENQINVLKYFPYIKFNLYPSEIVVSDSIPSQLAQPTNDNKVPHNAVSIPYSECKTGSPVLEEHELDVQNQTDCHNLVGTSDTIYSEYDLISPVLSDDDIENQEEPNIQLNPDGSPYLDYHQTSPILSEDELEDQNQSDIRYDGDGMSDPSDPDYDQCSPVLSESELEPSEQSKRLLVADKTSTAVNADLDRSSPAELDIENQNKVTKTNASTSYDHDDSNQSLADSSNTLYLEVLNPSPISEINASVNETNPQEEVSILQSGSQIFDGQDGRAFIHSDFEVDIPRLVKNVKKLGLSMPKIGKYFKDKNLKNDMDSESTAVKTSTLYEDSDVEESESGDEIVIDFPENHISRTNRSKVDQMQPNITTKKNIDGLNRQKVYNVLKEKEITKETSRFEYKRVNDADANDNSCKAVSQSTTNKDSYQETDKEFRVSDDFSKKYVIRKENLTDNIETSQVRRTGKDVKCTSNLDASIDSLQDERKSKENYTKATKNLNKTDDTQDEIVIGDFKEYQNKDTAQPGKITSVQLKHALIAAQFINQFPNKQDGKPNTSQYDADQSIESSKKLPSKLKKRRKAKNNISSKLDTTRNENNSSANAESVECKSITKVASSSVNTTLNDSPSKKTKEKIAQIRHPVKRPPMRPGMDVKVTLVKPQTKKELETIMFAKNAVTLRSNSGQPTQPGFKIGNPVHTVPKAVLATTNTKKKSNSSLKEMLLRGISKDQLGHCTTTRKQ